MLLSALLPLLAVLGEVAASPTPQRRAQANHRRKVCPAGTHPKQKHKQLHVPVASHLTFTPSPGSASPVALPITPAAPAPAPTAVTTPPAPIAASSAVSTAAGSPVPSPPAPVPAPAPPANVPAARADKHVFAHFMVGIVSEYTPAAWEFDIALAQHAGITGFALNIGVDPYNEKQLDLAYAAGDKLGFDLFISFDFNWFGLNDYDKVSNLLKRYAGKKSQLLVDGKVFVSTFIGDGFDWTKVAQAVGKELYSVPFYQPNQAMATGMGTSGLFSWAAWPGQLDNQPIKQNMTMDRDNLYLAAVEPQGKTYMAPVSPWFSTHFGPEVPYSKNWVFYSELLWKTRWDQVLEMGDKLNFIEIVTWNDYGESHHIGPYKQTPHSDDGSSKWNDGLDHTALLDMAKPYIAAFKAGLKAPVITQDMLVYWYRPHLKGVQCDGTDNCGSKPKGWDMLEDSVFVTILSKAGGTVTVTSGSNPPFTQQVPAGSHAFSVPMGVGKQHFSFAAAGGGGSGEATSDVPILNTCMNGIYNFNFHAGSVKL